jgi:hypothetical protein
MSRRIVHRKDSCGPTRMNERPQSLQQENTGNSLPRDSPSWFDQPPTQTQLSFCASGRSTKNQAGADLEWFIPRLVGRMRRVDSKPCA